MITLFNAPLQSAEALPTVNAGPDPASHASSQEFSALLEAAPEAQLSDDAEGDKQSAQAGHQLPMGTKEATDAELVIEKALGGLRGSNPAVDGKGGEETEKPNDGTHTSEQTSLDKDEFDASSTEDKQGAAETEQPYNDLANPTEVDARVDSKLLPLKRSDVAADRAVGSGEDSASADPVVTPPQDGGGGEDIQVQSEKAEIPARAGAEKSDTMPTGISARSGDVNPGAKLDVKLERSESAGGVVAKAIGHQAAKAAEGKSGAADVSETVLIQASGSKASQAAALSQDGQTHARAAEQSFLDMVDRLNAPETKPAEQVQKPPRPLPEFKSPLASSVASQIQSHNVEDGKVTIRLRPHGMGIIEVEIARQLNGQSSVTLRVQNPLVLEALRAEAGAVSEIWADQGGVDLEMFSHQDSQRRDAESAKKLSGKSVVADEFEEEQAAATAQSGIII